MLYVVRLTPDEYATILASLSMMDTVEAKDVREHLLKLSGASVEGEWKSGESGADEEE